ncbi:hypothetical protein LAUMK13_01065 [Mycobacterium innocens]|uniref:Uncharacterized protein n=1 Tax=Mycobacterium innocens TaxID=2341083 RepID=A0A498PTQ6_9MYCO|nr:hypothetical protein LAUMK13_01065 [Mycobacterium innocens]
MGDTYRDPVDHLHTTRPLAGESLIDVLHWPRVSAGGGRGYRRCRISCRLRHRA